MMANPESVADPAKFLPQAAELTNEEDVKVLLRGIFTELKKIGVHLARQGEQIELLQKGRQVIDPETTRTSYEPVSYRNLIAALGFEKSSETSKRAVRMQPPSIQSKPAIVNRKSAWGSSGRSFEKIQIQYSTSLEYVVRHSFVK
jgi:hypothetical protein